MSEVEAASAAPGEKRSAPRPRKAAAPDAAAPDAAVLAKASESGDPAVHKALAELNTAQQNQAAARDAAERATAIARGHDGTVESAAAALAELGFE